MTRRTAMLGGAVVIAMLGLGLGTPTWATDHNEPNQVNSILSGVDSQAEDMYGLLAWPESRSSHNDVLAVVLTFAASKGRDTFDEDVLYSIHLEAEADREERPLLETPSVADLTTAVGVAQANAAQLEAEGTRTLVDLLARPFRAKATRTIHFRFVPSKDGQRWAAQLFFEHFPGANAQGYLVPVQRSDDAVVRDVAVDVGGQSVRVFAGLRDDPFFIDLDGFFASFRYGGPEGGPDPWVHPDGAFGHQEGDNKRATPGVERLDIAKSLYLRDADGEVVHGPPMGDPREPRPLLIFDDGNDTQAGNNVHAISLEIPRMLLGAGTEEMVHVWATSRRRKEP